MNAGLRALLENVIDYAGMFPPAELPLAEAIANFARYRKEPEQWMLAKFVCPVAKLQELLAQSKDLFSVEARLPLSLTGALESTPQIPEDSPVRIDSFELRQAGVIPQNLQQPLFVESPAKDIEGVRATVQAVASQAAGRRCGFKLRCGGLEPAAIPAVELVAAAIVACRDAGVAMKFTAGLHHPLRHLDSGPGVKMHGFINVFVAGILARVHRLDHDQVGTILEEEDHSRFVFGDEGLQWHEWRATTEEIRAGRQHVTSFGSCSFDEPREDLRALGWLP